MCHLSYFMLQNLCSIGMFSNCVLWIMGLQTYSLFLWKFINFVFYSGSSSLKISLFWVSYMISVWVLACIFTGHVCVCVYSNLHRRWRTESFTWHAVRLQIGKDESWVKEFLPIMKHGVSIKHEVTKQLVLSMPYSHGKLMFEGHFSSFIPIIHPYFIGN